jgi:hypothetical protein
MKLALSYNQDFGKKYAQNLRGGRRRPAGTAGRQDSMVTLITVPSLANLNLQVGDSAWFLFKAFSVILNVD